MSELLPPAGSTPNRTVWVEIDETELVALRRALSIAEAHFEVVADESGLDPVTLDDLVRLRAVAARIPDAVAMRRRYP
jgi:hypothetical protein